MSLSALLQHLKSLPPEATLEEAVGHLQPQLPAATTEAVRHCALLRWFDPHRYAFVCDGLADKPEFSDFVQLPMVCRLAADRWTIESGERARLLAVWHKDAAAWRQWNQRLGDHFAADAAPDARLDAVYHLAASPAPEAAADRIRAWYAEADQRFDLAQCHALLEMLRAQQAWRGSVLSQVLDDCRLLHSARTLFLDDWYKTGSYLERDEPLTRFREVLTHKSKEEPWIFHIHATGGTGKTMFLRWLLARHLVPQRIPCARVDFDDFGRLADILDYPLQLFDRIMEQWGQQREGAPLQSLREKLRLEAKVAGWSPDILEEVNRQLAAAQLTAQRVVMLDTLEDVTRSATDWLRTCVDRLRDIRAACPGLVLVLSGRYDISRKTDALRPGEYVEYELPRFDDTESHAYLSKRGIAPGEVRDAIVKRASGEEVQDADGDAGPPASSTRNPFNLALIAELVLNRPNVDVDYVMGLEVGTAYLIERVVKRIESQPLRWMIRYGAIARELTQEFAEAALLPPLMAALRGQPLDEPQQGLNDDYKDTWQPDPAATDELARTGIGPLWDSLAGYARDRGWLTSSGTGSATKLRFHPEVIQPTRALLRRQPVFPDLQTRAVQFYEQQAAVSKLDNQSPEAQVTAAARCACEAVFHRFQRDGIAAESYWLDEVRAFERLSAKAALLVATEIVGRDYAEAQLRPNPHVSSPELLVRAHCEAADLLLQDAGTEFIHRRNWPEFNRHMELAIAIADTQARQAALVPRWLRTLHEIWRDSPQPAIPPDRLQAALDAVATPRERVILEVLLGRALAILQSSEAPSHYRNALQAMPGVERTGISASDVHLLLADYYGFHGAHAAALEAQQQAVSAADEPRLRARAVQKQAGYALSVGLLNVAERRIAELAATDGARSEAAAALLQSRVAILRLEPQAALNQITRARQLTADPIDHARLRDLEGQAQALRFAFGAAHDSWDSAASQYDVTAQPAGSAWCAVRRIRLRALVMGDLNSAVALLSAARNLRGSRDTGIFLELELLGAYLALRQGNREEAAQSVRMLAARAEWPLWPRTRAQIFALCFGLMPPTAGILEEIVDAVGSIQPLTRRNSLLDGIGHATDTIEVPANFVRRLAQLLPRPKSAQGPQMLIERADLYRILGRREEGERVLATAGDGNALSAWNLNLARERMGLATGFGSLLDRFADSEFAGSPLHDAVRAKAAAEALQQGERDVATRLVQAGVPALAEEISNAWLDLFRHVQAELEGPPADALASAESSAVLPPDEPLITLDEQALPSHFVAFEPVMDRLLGDSAGLVDEIGDLLPLRSEVALEARGRAAILPWELARTLLWRRSSHVPMPGKSFPNLSDPRAVLLLAPDEQTQEVALAATSGEQVEPVYHKEGARPQVVHRPDGSSLFRHLAKREGTALIHIVAAIRDSSIGPFLDFESTAERTRHLATPNTDSVQLSASALDRALAAVPQPPFLLLDIARPHNTAEAVRMLLLRNLFATQVFELGHVRGILGCGLGLPEDRAPLLRFILPRLLHDIVSTPLRLRPPPSRNLERDLAWQAMALWSNNPDDRLFVA